MTQLILVGDQYVTEEEYRDYLREGSVELDWEFLRDSPDTGDVDLQDF